MNNFKLIAGPCVIENEEITFEIARFMKNITHRYNIDYYFKASFDKANRTSIDSYRGCGLEDGLCVLGKIKQEVKVKTATDIHETWQAKPVAEVVDLLQIPAFLCRQTDLLLAAAETGLPVNVKKGQFLAPWDMKPVVDKLKSVNCKNVWLCERGTSFGYNRLVVDMTGLYEMKKFDCPVIFDATHSVQQPGSSGTGTGGNREYVPALARAATAVGIDGLFLEVHPEPDKALSDGPNSIALDDVEDLLDDVLSIITALNR